MRALFFIIRLLLFWFLSFRGFKEFDWTDEQSNAFGFIVAIVVTVLILIAEILYEINKKLK